MSFYPLNMNKSDITVSSIPSEVWGCFNNSLFLESHSCCSAERAHEEFVEVNPYDRWGRFMGSCVAHLLLFSSPLSPNAALFTLPASPNTYTSLLVISLYCATAQKYIYVEVAFHLSAILYSFSWFVKDDRNSKLDDSLHPSLFRHQVLSTSMCAYRKRKEKNPHEFILSGESCETLNVSIQSWTTLLMV